MTDCIFDIETTGLFDSLFERVLCVCVHNTDTKEVLTFINDDEQKILDDFFSYLSSLNKPVLFGFNSESFDLPFLVRRAVVYKKRIPQFRSVDLRKKVNGFAYSHNNQIKGTLRDWAGIFGFTINTDGGSEMFRLYKEKKWDEIKAHCNEDIKVTTKLYEHAKECGLLEWNPFLSYRQ